MPEAVPASGRVRNFKVCGHVNMVSLPTKRLVLTFACVVWSELVAVWTLTVVGARSVDTRPSTTHHWPAGTLVDI